ncbi:MAG: ATPase [Acidobacteriota bacterium]
MPFHPPIPNPRQPSKGGGLVSAIVQAEKMMQIALILPCSAFVGWLLGGWLGLHFHVPWLGLVGLVFGGVSGLVYVVRLAMQAARAPEEGDGKRETKE